MKLCENLVSPTTKLVGAFILTLPVFCRGACLDLSDSHIGKEITS